MSTRPPSKILSAAEQLVQKQDNKKALAEAKVAAKAAADAVKAATKAKAALAKTQEAALKGMQKEHAAAIKQADAVLTSSTKNSERLAATLAKLTPAPAVQLSLPGAAA